MRQETIVWLRLHRVKCSKFNSHQWSLTDRPTCHHYLLLLPDFQLPHYQLLQVSSQRSAFTYLLIPGLPHTLIEHSYRQFTVCKVCDHLLVGLVKQGLKCRDCGVNVHRKCAMELASNCVLSENAISRVNFVEQEATTSSLDNIPLFRLPGQVGVRATEKKNLEGWMMHFILSDPERRLKHYWMMQNNAIHLYNEYTEGIGVNPNRVYRIIPLAEITSVVQNNGKSVLAKHPPHCFEIRTTTNTVYCVGEDYHAFSGGPPKKIPRSMSVRPMSNTNMWFQVGFISKLPVILQFLQFIKESLQPPSRNEDNAEQALEFANLYQVLSDKTLGSGQFGTVYSAIQRHSGKEVAVKVSAALLQLSLLSSDSKDKFAGHLKGALLQKRQRRRIDASRSGNSPADVSLRNRVPRVHV